MESNNRKMQYLATVAVSLATLTMGMTSAWPTPILPKLRNNQTSVDITKNEIAWMLAMSPPGFMVGSFISGFTSDNLGRRATMMWSALPYGTGMIIVAWALVPWLLCVTQFLWSCGTGMLSTVIALYFTEIADKSIRGTLQLVTRVTFNLGTLITMTIGPYVTYTTLNYMLLVMPVIYFLACWSVPETPYFYLKEGKLEAAKKALRRLRGYEDNTKLEQDLKQMQSDVKKEMRHSSSPKELFTGKQYRKALIIATGLKVTQIMTGIMTIQQYLGLIMEESKINMNTSDMILIFGFVKFLVSIMPSVLADRLGRRPLLVYSYFGTSLSLFTVGIYFFLMDVVGVDHATLSPYGFITFIGILASNVISTIGFQSVLMVVAGEIFPLNVKSVAMTSMGIFGGLLGFGIGRGYQALKDIIGLTGVFWVFATIALGGALFSLFYIPETKGKSLREIQTLLQGDKYETEEEALKEVDLNGVCVESKELEVLNKKEKE